MFAADFGILLLVWAFPQEAPGDQLVNTFIRQLDGLGDSAPAEAFLQRPALMELIALLDHSAPALIRAFKDPATSTSIKAGAAYVLIVNRIQSLDRDLDMRDALQGHLDSTSPLLRTVAARGIQQFDTLNEEARKLLTQPPFETISNTLFPVVQGLDNPVEWLPDDYLRRRTERLIQLAGKVREFERTRPRFDDGPEDEVLPRITDEMSWLGELLSMSISQTRQGHFGASLLLQQLRAVEGSDVNKLSALLSLSHSIPDHHDASHITAGVCPLESRLEHELLAVMDRHVWAARDGQLMRHIIAWLDELGPEGLALLARLAKEHPLQDARELADVTLKNHHAGRAKRLELEEWMAQGKIQQAAHLEALRKKARRTLPAPAPPPGAPAPAKPLPGPLTEPSGKPWTLGVFLGIGLCFILFRMFRKANP